MGSKSAPKQVRVAARRQQGNKSVRSQVKTNITKAEKLLFSGELAGTRVFMVAVARGDPFRRRNRDRGCGWTASR